MTVRSAAVERESASIDASTSRAIAARAEERKPRNALEAMAANLRISPQGLKTTLVNTVFAKCENEEQFMALVVVANTYGLNPLLKEIYAFPAKGQGIVPMVSVDGWIRIMNEHPQFDGLEFDYHEDAKGNTVAIESIIRRKDRSHAIKTIEYMDECKGDTGPWKKSPRRMLRHRALMQGARIAFGFSGIAAEGDEEEFINGGAIQGDVVQVLPTRQTLAEELDDEIPRFDKDEAIDAGTGEVLETDSRGMTEVDEETARELDAGQADVEEIPVDADFIGAKPGAASKNQTWYNPETDELRYAHETAHGIKWYMQPQDDAPAAAEPEADDAPPWDKLVKKIRKGIKDADTKAFLTAVEKDFTNIMAGLPDEVVAELEGLFAAKKKTFQA